MRKPAQSAALPQKLWLLTWATRPEDKDCDYWEQLVVVAPDEETARGTHPLAGDPGQADASGWAFHEGWAATPGEVEAKLLGEAAPGIAPGVVTGSYVAG